jgi:hypothetical protein
MDKVRSSCNVSVSTTDHVDQGRLEVILIKKIDWQSHPHFEKLEMFITNVYYIMSLINMKLGLIREK